MNPGRKLTFAIGAAVVAAIVLVAVGVIALGGDDEPEGSQAVSAEEAAAGAQEPNPQAVQLFQDTCAQCHTLTVAGSEANVGPNLDGIQYDREVVLEAIETGAGGSGQMAPDLLEGEDAELVAELIANDEPLRSTGDPPP